MGGKEALRMERRLEPLHLLFSPSRGLVRGLGPVNEIAALPMLDTRQDFTLCRAVDAQLVGHDHPRNVLQSPQQFAEEPLGRLTLPPEMSSFLS